MHGIRSAHLPFKPARHRGLPARPVRQALPHGHPWRRVEEHALQRQQRQGLAHPCRLRPAPDREARRLHQGEDHGLDIDNTVCALDSSTIDLCLSLFPWARFRKTKGAVKLHTLLDLRGSIPAFIHISDGKLHDVNLLDILAPEPGAFYIMDRAYLDLSRLHRLHLHGAHFVLRAKKNTKLRRLYSAAVDRATGVICEQVVRPSGVTTSKDYPDKLRRIKYIDRERGKSLVFLTNDFVLPPLTIAQLYKARWRVELFFK